MSMGVLRSLAARLVWVAVVAGGISGCDRVGMFGQVAGPVARSAVAGTGNRLISITEAQRGDGLHLAYTHEIGLELPGAVLAAHFAAAQDRCLKDASLHCLLLHAEIGAPQSVYQDGGMVVQSASLRVRLPHDQVAGFAAGLTAALPGEAAGSVLVTRQSTSADDLGQPVADAAQRVAQLSEYLASLKVLGARLTISVADQVKIAEETARTQTQMEEAQARQRELALRVDTEEVDVGFSARVAAVAAVDPITGVLAEAPARLRTSAAEALAFAIEALPWVPVGILWVLVLWVVRVLVFGRRRRRVTFVPAAKREG